MMAKLSAYVVNAEKIRERLAAGIDLFRGGQCQGVRAAPGIAAIFRKTARHFVGDTAWLGEGGGGVVKINHNSFLPFLRYCETEMRAARSALRICDSCDSGYSIP